MEFSPNAAVRPQTHRFSRFITLYVPNPPGLTNFHLYLIITWMAEFRRDPISGNWIVSGYVMAKSGAVGECPFCPGNESQTPSPVSEFKNTANEWQIRCFPAANPVFLADIDEAKKAEGLYDKMGNVGAHEIVVENRSHTKTLSGFAESELLLLMEFYMERILHLKQDSRFKYVQVFKNHGELAGSFLFHPHSHILAMPVVPQMIETELSNTKKHYLKKERCLFCDIIAQEVRQNKRLVSINTNFVAVCPFASRFPYEVRVLPRFHDDSFENSVDQSVMRDLASIMLDIMKRVEKVANAYTMVLHTSPNAYKDPYGNDDLPISEYFHWHIEILPRDLRSSRFKRDDQFYVVSITPEEATNSLKTQKT
jgi:UDPglucose--hexose-1-phosphate uridylyltransferase